MGEELKSSGVHALLQQMQRCHCWYASRHGAATARPGPQPRILKPCPACLSPPLPAVDSLLDRPQPAGPAGATQSPAALIDSLLAHPGSSSGGNNDASPQPAGSSSAAAAADSSAPPPQLLAADLIVAQALQSRKEADAASAQQRQTESAGILQKLRGLLQAESTAKAAANAKNMLAADFIVAQALQNRQEAEAEAASAQQRQAESVETQQKLRGLLEAEAAANAAANAEKLRQEQEQEQAAAPAAAAGLRAARTRTRWALMAAFSKGVSSWWTTGPAPG